MHSLPRAWLPALAVALALPAVGCGSGSQATTDAATSTADSGGPPHVAMKVLEFSPVAVRARVGQWVTWTNEDSSPHNVTRVRGPDFKSSGTITPGSRFAVRLTQPGTVHYFCSLHPWMKATIVVSP
jgi:plastocyanin